MRISRSLLAAASLLALSNITAFAQQVTGVPGSPGATTTITENNFRRPIRNSAG